MPDAPKTILITGATDGIGRLAAQKLAALGHKLLLHGRSEAKLAEVAAELGGDAQCYVADLSGLADVTAMAAAICADHPQLDVLINNAGVLKAPRTVTADGLDLRFMVNTLAPYELTRLLLAIIPRSGRIVNVSSAAQAPVDLDALAGRNRLADMPAYAQSKLAITLWSRELARELPDGPVVVSVNPGSLLGTKMVREGFGLAGKDVGIGADILVKAALHDSFAHASGAYFNNDAGRFGPPHAAALDAAHAKDVMAGIEAALSGLRG